MSNIVHLPRITNTSLQGHSMPGLTTPELRLRAMENFYSAERRKGVDPITAYDRMTAYGDDLERIAKQMENLNG